jgi:hypothetical protein
VSRELNERRSSVDEWDSYIYEEQFLPVNSEKIEGDGGVYAKIKYRSNC